MHRCISWAYVFGLLLPPAAESVVTCRPASLSAPYRPHVACPGASAHAPKCRTRCILPCTGSSSNSMEVRVWTSRPLGNPGGAWCHQAGSLAALMSMMLLLADVRDRASGRASHVPLESDICCVSCVWSLVSCGVVVYDFGTLLSSCSSCFSKIRNPKSTNLCAGSLGGAPIHRHFRNSETKTLCIDRSIIQHFIHATGFRCFL